MKFAKTILASSITFLLVSSANAATETATFAVGATVVDSCSVSASALTFSDIDPIVNATTATDGQTTIGVTCANGTAYNVGLSAGLATGATVATRAMTSGENTLSYSLYSDSGRATVWGETVATDTVSGAGTGAAQTLNVYARVPSGQQAVPTGTYSDTITVTVTF